MTTATKMKGTVKATEVQRGKRRRERERERKGKGKGKGKHERMGGRLCGQLFPRLAPPAPSLVVRARHSMKRKG